jgi:hypothetical protein
VNEIEIDDPSPDFEWVIYSQPDVLVVQFPPLGVRRGIEGVDAIHVLFEARGLVKVTSLVPAELPSSNGCVLQKVSPFEANLRLDYGPNTADNTFLHDEPAWSARVFRAGRVAVYACDAAIDAGTIDNARLEREVAAGGVWGAMVPASNGR